MVHVTLSPSSLQSVSPHASLFMDSLWNVHFYSNRSDITDTTSSFCIIVEDFEFDLLVGFAEFYGLPTQHMSYITENAFESSNFIENNSHWEHI